MKSFSKIFTKNNKDVPEGKQSPGQTSKIKGLISMNSTQQGIKREDGNTTF